MKHGRTVKFALAAGLAMVLAPHGGAIAQSAGTSSLAELEASLPGTLINDPTSLAWNTQGSGLKTGNITGGDIPGGGAATRYDVRTPGPSPWSVQVYVPLTSDIAEGDAVTFGFWARAETPPQGSSAASIGVRIQSNIDPWPGFGDTQIAIEPGWKWYEASAKATTAVPRRNGVLVFQIGGAKQQIVIGQTIIIKGADRIIGDGARPPEPLPPQIEGKGALVSQPHSGDWSFQGPPESRAPREDRTIYLQRAVQFTSATASEEPWTIQAHIPLTEAISEGDRVLVAVAAKTVSAQTDDGKALIGIRIQEGREPFGGFADNRFKVGPNWQLIQIQTTATMDLPEGGGQVALNFAGAAQVVDVGPVYVIKLPPSD